MHKTCTGIKKNKKTKLWASTQGWGSIDHKSFVFFVFFDACAGFVKIMLCFFCFFWCLCRFCEDHAFFCLFFSMPAHVLSKSAKMKKWKNMRFTSISDLSGAKNTVNYNVLCLFSFKNHPPMVARSLSFWYCQFLGAMLNFRAVLESLLIQNLSKQTEGPAWMWRAKVPGISGLGMDWTWRFWSWWWSNMGVSKNNGTPKSSILIGFSIINYPFWGTPTLGNIHLAGSQVKVGICQQYWLDRMSTIGWEYTAWK